jgi:hypothetical protein
MDSEPMQFEDVATEEWFSKALELGNWDAEHGSDIGDLIESIQSGEWDFVECPATLKTLAVQDAFKDPEMVAVLWQWVRGRFDEVVESLPKASEIGVRRIMRVDRDWIDGLADGSSTTGIYFGDRDMDTDGGYWIDEAQPFSVMIDAVAKAADVDWKGTILARMDHMTGNREAEIRLYEHSTVSIRSIWIDDTALENFPATMSTGEKRARPAINPGPKI